jgi:hypothetical protein
MFHERKHVCLRIIFRGKVTTDLSRDAVLNLSTLFITCQYIFGENEKCASCQT